MIETKKSDLVGLFEAYENAVRAEEAFDKRYLEISAAYSEAQDNYHRGYEERKARRNAFVDALRAAQATAPDAGDAL